MTKRPSIYFPGLNALRFFAASLVILTHIPVNQANLNLAHLPTWPIFTMGTEGVNFFFVLSGFLISFLLLKEQEDTHEIKVRYFYWRRILRIWPLYIIIVVFGLFFYKFIVPNAGLSHGTNYPLSVAVPLYLLFLPHLVNSFFKVGGILHVVWSVGVEEHFYLFWAPIVKRFYQVLHWVCACLAAIFFLVHFLNFYVILDWNHHLMTFISHLRFQYMFLGGLGAYYLFRYPAKLRKVPIFKHAVLRRIFFWSIIVFLFCFQSENLPVSLLARVPMAFLYVWLILDVIINAADYKILEHPTLKWLGQISYGLYMYHMIVIYLVSFLFVKFFSSIQACFVGYLLIYYGLVFSLTILIAHVSYNLIEKQFLILKKR